MAAIKIYIANLGKYNEGELVGEWLSLPATDEQLNDLFVKIKLGEYDDNHEYKSGFFEDGLYYEEYAIHDYECDINGLEIGEYISVSELNDIAVKLEKLDKNKLKQLEAYIEASQCDIEEALEKYGDAIYYSNMSPEDVARDLLHERFKIPDGLEEYIDYEIYANELVNEDLYETKYGCIQIS